MNEGDEPHSFTAADQEFDTGRMLPGDETTLVLTEPDDITYFDREATDHEGRLVVLDQSVSRPSASTPPRGARGALRC